MQANALVERIRRVLEPVGSGPDVKMALAQCLIDVAREIDQTGGMKTLTAPAITDAAPAMSAAQLLDRWRPGKLLESSPAYVRQVESLLRDLVLFVCRPADHDQLTTEQAVRVLERDRLTMAGIDAAAIIGFVSYIREKGRPSRDQWHASKGRGASDKTCNDYISALRSFFAWAMTIPGSGVLEDPCAGVKWVGGRRRGGGGRGRTDRRAFTAAEARAIIQASPLKWSEWYRAAAEIGMRAGAFEKLRVEHFEIQDRGAARIRPTPDLSRKGLPEQIPISAELAGVVAARIARHGLQLGQVVFGRRPTRRTFLGHVEGAGIPMLDERGRRLGLHSFRRFVGTELQRQGVPIKVAQERLGHASIETTLRYYSDHRVSEHQAATDKLQSVLDGWAGSGSAVPVGQATGPGSARKQSPSPRRLVKTDPYQLAGSGDEWALQGSNL